MSSDDKVIQNHGNLDFYDACKYEYIIRCAYLDLKIFLRDHKRFSILSSLYIFMIYLVGNNDTMLASVLDVENIDLQNLNTEQMNGK
jgi:hypothetical protein